MASQFDDFNQFMGELNGGATAQEFAEAMALVRQAVRDFGKGGAVTLKIAIKPGNKGGVVDRVVITPSVTAKLPSAEPREDFFWLTDDRDASFSRQHPRQRDLELKQVEAEPIPYKDIQA